MAYLKMVAAAGLALALAACEGRSADTEEPQGDAAAKVSAEGKAEDGKVTIKAPGFDLAIRIPDAVSRRAVTDRGTRIVPPGSRFGGIHIEGGRSAGPDGGHGEVEMRFSADTDPAATANWYRDAARTDDFTVSGARREGDGYVVEGQTREDSGTFTARVTPGAAGGSDIRLLLRDRE
jgi:hypothetical protein